VDVDGSFRVEERDSDISAESKDSSASATTGSRSVRSNGSLDGTGGIASVCSVTLEKLIFLGVLSASLASLNLLESAIPNSATSSEGGENDLEVPAEADIGICIQCSFSFLSMYSICILGEEEEAGEEERSESALAREMSQLGITSTWGMIFGPGSDDGVSLEGADSALPNNQQKV
jgi:hypothetical protein